MGSQRQLLMTFAVLLAATPLLSLYARPHRQSFARGAPRDEPPAMKPRRILVLLHPTLVPPDSLDGRSEKEIDTWKTEYDVVSTLRESGHEVRPLGVQDELKPIRDVVEEWKPHAVFNLLEEFHGEVAYDQNVASYLELMRVPYTGCNPRGLMLARGKALSKKLLHYHRIPVPAFAVFAKQRKIRR